ncbi:MAG: hypothetical protein IAE83_00200 [Anaerolinea sp.]|nr:hypothetical protein [Anaerolinea sp.]
MLNEHEVFRALGVAPAGLLITGIQTILWGSEIRFVCLYDPDHPRTFRMIFKDTLSILWEVFDRVDERDTTADVIGILFDNENRKCIITTDVFEISVSYGQLIFEKDW